MLQYFVEFGSHVSAPLGQGTESVDPEAVKLAEMLNRPIDDLELSVRSVNSLKNSTIRTLGDLVRQNETQILQVKNFGKKSLQEIADLLEKRGLNFGMRFEEKGPGVKEREAVAVVNDKYLGPVLKGQLLVTLHKGIKVEQLAPVFERLQATFAVVGRIEGLNQFTIATDHYRLAELRQRLMEDRRISPGTGASTSSNEGRGL